LFIAAAITGALLLQGIYQAELSRDNALRDLRPPTFDAPAHLPAVPVPTHSGCRFVSATRFVSEW